MFVIVLTVLGGLGWMVKTAIDYRRWGRLTKVQTEAHTKLLDRFTGNEELLAYVKSPAGSGSWSRAPIMLDGGAARDGRADATASSGRCRPAWCWRRAASA